MAIRKDRIIFIIVFTLLGYCIHGQEALFHPFIQNYSYQDYKAGTSNWWVIEDDRGIIYVANREGILEYDGNTWTLIESSDQEVARSLAKDDKGMIYAGFVGDLGYLDPDEVGKMKFVSLREKIPEEYRRFKEVWRTYFWKGNVYFQTRQNIFRWTGTEMKILEASDNLNHGAIVRDEYYVGVWGKGLCKVEDGQFNLIPGGEKFANLRMYAILPYGEKSTLIGTSSDGFFISDGVSIRPFYTEVDDEIKGQLYSSCLSLDDGRIVINTLAQGVFILDQEGRLLENFNQDIGLQDNVVDYVYVDSRGILWMALFNGISTVNLKSKFSYLEENSGLPSSTVNDCIRHKGYFYAGTVNGVYFYNPTSQQFELLKGTVGHVYQFLTHRDRLYAASSRMGLFEIKGKSMKYVRKNVNNDFQIGMMRLCSSDNDRMYVDKRPGIASLYFDETLNAFQEESFTSQIDPNYPGFEVDSLGHIWTLGKTKGTLEQLIPTIKDGHAYLENSELIIHTQSNGLPSRIKAILKIGNRLDFLGDQPFNYDHISKKFFKKETFYSEFYKPGAQYFSFPKSDPLGRIWLQAGLGVAVHSYSNAEQKDLVFKPFREVKDLPIWSIYVDHDPKTEKTTSWFSSPEGMIKYEGKIQNEEKQRFNVLLREIVIGTDQIAHGGAASTPDPMNINFQNNSIRFTYSTPLFHNEKDILYQTYLEGLDEKWSEKTSDGQKYYMNLPPGEYTFQVRAFNAYGDESDLTSYSFQIEPSLWRTWWMIALYLLAAVLFMTAVNRWSTANLEKRQKELEETIEKRTNEVVEEKKRVEKLYQYQSTLLSEVHHRIKNNLQLIISLLTLQKVKIGKEMDTGVLDMLSHRINSISLIHEQLYNIREFDKVNTPLYAEQLLQNFSSLMHERDVDVNFEIDDINFNLETITPLGLIWSELISNSLKYNGTKSDLKIYFKLIETEKGYHMHYRDNGVGYPNGKFDSNKSGMGHTIINSLTRQLSAKTDTYNSDGAHFIMDFQEKVISPID